MYLLMCYLCCIFKTSAYNYFFNYNLNWQVHIEQNWFTVCREHFSVINNRVSNIFSRKIHITHNLKLWILKFNGKIIFKPESLSTQVYSVKPIFLQCFR
jgi:hypothetical protein